MTVEDRILQRAVKQGIEQGIKQTKMEMPKRMLFSSIDEQLILTISGLCQRSIG